MSAFRWGSLALLAVVPALAITLLAALPPDHKALLIGTESTLGVNPTGTRSPLGKNVQRGIAKYYSPGVFEEVARNRKMRLRAVPADVFGYAAVADCGRIGQVVLASVGSLGPERYQVLDCVQSGDLQAHTSEGLIIEVDYATAVRAGLVDNDCYASDGSVGAQHGCGRAIIYGYLGT